MTRERDVALFLKTKPGFSFETFEVVIVQKSRDHVGPRGNLILAGEHMPSSEDWGTKGWSYSDREDAWKKFNELKARPEQGLLLEV